jgi:acylphosphatase
VRVHVVVTGRVQGVGFRYYIATQARALGLTGTVRNLPTGQVEITAEGDSAPLEALIGAARSGPPGSRVRDLQVRWDDVPRGEREFLIR